MTDILIRHQGGVQQQGFYSTADARTRVSLEHKGTHFSLGNHTRISGTNLRAGTNHNRNIHTASAH
jgi:hypothetical protein